jgi:hypothetical protein
MKDEQTDCIECLKKELKQWKKHTCYPILNNKYEIVAEIAKYHGHLFEDDHEYIYVGKTNVCPPDTKHYVNLHCLNKLKNDGNLGEFFIFDSQCFWKYNDPFKRQGPIRLYLQRNELFFVTPCDITK